VSNDWPKRDKFLRWRKGEHGALFLRLGRVPNVIHPLSDLFPLTVGSAFEELTEDSKPWVLAPIAMLGAPLALFHQRAKPSCSSRHDPNCSSTRHSIRRSMPSFK
jgi:hypothetical protein